MACHLAGLLPAWERGGISLPVVRPLSREFPNASLRLAQTWSLLSSLGTLPGHLDNPSGSPGPAGKAAVELQLDPPFPSLEWPPCGAALKDRAEEK